LQEKKSGWEAKMSAVERTYGTALSLHLRTEKAILSKYKRMPGLPSSNVGIDCVLGEDEEIGFADVLSGEFACMFKLNHVHTLTALRFLPI
jgi:hypothetical protein